MTGHVPAELLVRYAEGDPGVNEAMVWSVEAHLETCPACRARLAGGMDQGTARMLARVRDGLADEIASAPPPARRRLLGRGRWAVPALLPWLLATITVLGAALLLQQTFPEYPSPVLLAAPLAPLCGVAAAWSRHTDPAYELVSASPRAGLAMVLRRTLVVLALVIPLLALAGWGVGESPAMWLLPCLAFTAATLALGGLIGVARAAALLASGWVLAVIVPAMAAARLPVLVRPESLPGWVAATAVLAAVVLLRAPDHRWSASRD